ncbi:MAG TPA: DEAD/DEAH box helicase, partial [Polyangiaceae bacterium]|nr:DEAD/DEAH box helicase [Polyangiaceae bacterium]
LDGWLAVLGRARRVVTLGIAGEQRYAAAEDSGKLCAALGLAPPPGLPPVFLEPGPRPLVDVLARYARTHGPFDAAAPARRFGLEVPVVERALGELVREGRVLEGAFLAGGRGREYCEREALSAIKHKSLALLRAQVEPVPPASLALLYADWQGIGRRRAGTDALLAVVEQLEGASLPASSLESDVLPARMQGYEPGLLDDLMLGGELVWIGVEPIGDSDGRIALYRSDRFDLLAPPPRQAEGELCRVLREALAQRGASFFAELARKCGAFPPDVLRALWDMVWAGEVKNDTLLPLRARLGARERDRKSRGRTPRPRGLPGSEGRWSLVAPSSESATSRRLAQVRTLLDRFGVVTREAVQTDGLALSFADAYPVLKALEESGKVRRGYFVEGLGGAQFAEPGADDRLRLLRRQTESGALLLSAIDPANPYGAGLPWPPGGRCQRTPGAYVVLFRGELVAYLGKTEQTLVTFLPAEEPEREQAAQAIASTLASAVDGVRRRALLLGEIDGAEATASVLAPALASVGFSASSRGLLLRKASVRSRNSAEQNEDDEM